MDASKDEAPATAEAQAREAADTAPAALSGEEAAEATVEAEEAEKGHLAGMGWAFRWEKNKHMHLLHPFVWINHME